VPRRSEQESSSKGLDGTEFVNNKAKSQLSSPRQTMSNRDSTRSSRPLDFSGTAYVGEVYKSNIFKLQVDELLEQVQPKHHQHAPAIERTLRTFKHVIETIPRREPLLVQDAERTLLRESKVRIPFPDPRPPRDAKYKLQYVEPEHINIAGSYPLHTATKTEHSLVIDIVVKMPSSIFQEKDYLNHRYFHKRAYYLACLAAGIQNREGSHYRLNFDCLHGNSLLPVLTVEPILEASFPKGYRFVVLPAINESVFPPVKLLPSRSCIRPKNSGENSGATVPKPTPFYNASLLVDSSIAAYLKLQHETAKQCEAYQDACVLGRVWLRQRGLSGSIRSGGFGNFEWATIIALLLRGGGPKNMPAFSPGYSSYQLFKATLQYISTKDLSKTPEIICGEKFDLGQSDGVPIFFDAPRSLNILFKMTPWSYRLLQYEARATMAALSGSVFDQFDAAFIVKADHALCRFDYFVDIPVAPLIAPKNHSEDLMARCKQLHTALTQGLMDRIKLADIHLPEDKSWTVDSNSSPIDPHSKLRIGFIVDSFKVNRTIDHGPSAEEKQAAALFRRFWGEKAELRRFKDGRILECLVWSNKNDDRLIFHQVLSCILEKHISEEVSRDTKFVGDQPTKMFGHSLTGMQTGIAPFQAMGSAFQALERDIRSLSDLPLQIRHILASSSQLSYSSIEVPLLPGYRHISTPADVVIQFEGSARWPDDLAAIQRTKIAFLLKLSELLSDSIDGISARVALENEGTPLLNQSFLDIAYSSGATFRLRIHHDREATLLERRLKIKTLTTSEKTDTATALASYKRTFIHEPAHTQAIQTLCTRFPSLSPSIRLVKKWFSSHLLSTHFCPFLIDLFVVRTFTNPYPWASPSSPSTAFFRTLTFLSRWDWRSEPWIVDLSAEGTGFKAEDVTAIRTRFEAWRKLDPAMNRVVLFAASNVDTDGNTWTDRTRPPKVVAGRMTALAKAAVKEMKERDATDVDFEGLFRSGLGDYDFVVHIDKKAVGKWRGKDKKAEVYKNLQIQASAMDYEMVGFDPVKLFVQDLEELYGEAMVLFYDEDVGDVIAGLWDPQTEKRGWKLKLAYSSVPVASTAKSGEDDAEDVDVRINKEAILNEIARLGGDMISRIEVNRN
jgi:U3 small nucleolar RNA-associated protein 22